MSHPMRFLIVAALLVVATSCSDGAADEPYDPAAAESCEELADMFVGSTQRMLDALEGLVAADLEGDIPSAVDTAGAEIGEWFFGSTGERIAQLCTGGAEEFEKHACDEASTLKVSGPEAERHMRDNFPTCEPEETEITTTTDPASRADQ